MSKKQEMSATHRTRTETEKQDIEKITKRLLTPNTKGGILRILLRDIGLAS
jgi:hypothetical protein